MANLARARPHVLILGPDWEVTARFRMELIRRLMTEGWRVTVMAGGADGDDRRLIGALGADCRSVAFDRGSLNPLVDLKALNQVRSFCVANRPDAVLAFTVKPCTFGIIGAWLGGRRALVAMVTGLGFAFIEGTEVKRRLVRAVVSHLYRVAGRMTSAWIFQNRDDHAVLAGLGAVRSDLVRFVGGSGVDIKRFAATPLPEGPITFLMIARLIAEKGVREYVEAARLVHANYPDVRFLLVGATDSNPTAVSAEELATWKADGVVDYLGPLDDVRPALQKVSVFVLPSYREGTPRSALEALASARPVLVTDVPGCREVVKKDVSGRLALARDSHSLAKEMRWFIEHADRLPEMAKAAREIAVRDFDVAQVTRSIVNTLQVAISSYGAVKSGAG